MDKIQQYRQPMVTASGIFLGFMLEFTTGWIPTAFSARSLKDLFIAGCVFTSIALLIVVLFRILRMNYPAHLSDKYYTRTLIVFLIAVSIPFLAFVAIIIKKLLNVL